MTATRQLILKTLGIAAVFSFCLSQVGLCLEPPTKEQIEQYKKDGTLAKRIADAKAIGNHLVPPEIALRTNQKLQNLLRKSQGLPALEMDPPRTPPLAWRGLPTIGTPKIFTLLIAFADYPYTNSATSINSKIFGAGSGGYPYESLKNFYTRSSYGLLTIGGNTLGWYTTAYDRSAVVQNDTGRENLIKEALNYFNTTGGGHDFSQYDNNGDGKIDYFVVIWTGPPGAWATFWWGKQVSWNATSLTLDGKTLGKYSWQWETNADPPGTFIPNVVIHETGHALGVPDFYDYDNAVGPRGGVGGLDQMDANKGDHNSWSKFLLDWLTPTVYSGGTNTATLRMSNAYQDAAIFLKGTTGGMFGEFFMVQNRKRGNNDPSTYPADGLLIWHVDSRLNDAGTNFRYDNSFTSHKILRLMEADGLEQIEQGLKANAGDYYIAGKEINPTSTPSTYKYDGSSSIMGVRNISAIGDSMTCEIYEVTGDTSAPTGVPSTPTDEGAVSTDDTLQFNWNAGTAADPESGLGWYQLQVGTTPGGNNVFDGIVGSATNYTVTGGWEGEMHYARVRISNTLGLFSEWSNVSDGILVDLPAFSCTALDNCDLTFKTNGDLPWIEQPTVVYYGSMAGRSGGITDEMSSNLISRVIGPGTLKFWWKVSSEADFDFLRFHVDRVAQNGISGEVGWTQQTYAIPGGVHELKWEYAKDEAVDDGDDAGYIDKVEWIPPTGSARFYTVTPCRVFDTRVNSGDTAGYPALAAGERRVFPVAGKCGIPTTAQAIVANVTVVGATQTGDLQATASTLSSTTTSVLSIPLTRARANNATIQLGPEGIAVKNASTGIVDVILDVVGYFQ